MIKIIQTRSITQLEHEVNEFNATHNVFATQTHVTSTTSDNFITIVYTAVLFYKD